MVTLFSRAPTSILLEPGAPSWAQRFALRLASTFKLINPQAPVAIWGVNSADLPPATDWPGCLVVVPDLNVLAVSDGTVWRRINLGATIP